MSYSFKKVFLIIIDGFGLAPAGKNNPVSIAKMPFLNSLVKSYPVHNIVASGLVVGLPWGKPGNSEVGHSAIGTGRVIVQDWVRINSSIEDGSFFSNPAFMSAIENCRLKKSNLHIIGCASPGGIHSHEDHLKSLLDLVAKENVPAFVHMITDGEDSGPTESSATLSRMRKYLDEARAKIATVIGRVYGMDRVLNWEVTQKTWRAIVDGIGEQIFDAGDFLALNHKNGIDDDQITPAVILESGKPVATVSDSDSVIFFNYRNDRAKQLLAPFVVSDFSGFARTKIPKNLFVVTMTRYSNELPVDAVAFEAVDIQHTLGREISDRNLSQFRVAEKEKEAHVNNFFDGGRIEPYKGTEQVIVTSRQLRQFNYPKHPEMSAEQIVVELLARRKQNFAFYLANFANADMMAHTGKIDAAVAGLKVIDNCLKEIAEAVLDDPFSVLVITSDHGNSEELVDPATGGPDTRHSTNNVIALFAGKGLEQESDNSLESIVDRESSGSLIDLAPTILKLLSFEKPVEMTGSSLL